ncbi:MAG: NUDIX hydrolase [Egibacteraceae bacterium]
MSYTSVIDVLLLLVREHHVLLALRENTGYADGQWNLPSGKLEDSEHILDALVRETREEIALDIDPGQARMVVALHNRNPEGQARVGFFFEVARWCGEPANAEPHKCAKLAWHPLDMLPANTVPYTAAGIAHYLHNQPFRPRAASTDAEVSGAGQPP